MHRARESTPNITREKNRKKNCCFLFYFIQDTIISQLGYPTIDLLIQRCWGLFCSAVTFTDSHSNMSTHSSSQTSLPDKALKNSWPPRNLGPLLDILITPDFWKYFWHGQLGNHIIFVCVNYDGAVFVTTINLIKGV